VPVMVLATVLAIKPIIEYIAEFATKPMALLSNYSKI